MKGLPEDRAVQFARYIIEAGATVRETAKEFHISKSTVHKDIQERLPLKKAGKEKGVIIGNGVYEPGKVTDTPAMQQAYQMGKNV